MYCIFDALSISIGAHFKGFSLFVKNSLMHSYLMHILLCLILIIVRPAPIWFISTYSCHIQKISITGVARPKSIAKYA